MAERRDTQRVDLWVERRDSGRAEQKDKQLG